jgi:hypothetical protein
MCIFAFPVESVSNTRIAIVHLPTNRQLTVYENAVSTSTTSGNVMILPVPNSQRVEMVDLSRTGWRWSEIDNTFFPQKQKYNYEALSFGSGGGFGMEFSAPLPVTQCGGYDVSYAHMLEDIGRIDVSVFVLPRDIEAVLKTHYGQGFGFVICKFKQGRTAGHPIAYSHGLLPSGSLFIPTRHEHGTESIQNGTEVEHDEVVCDGCGEHPIKGMRWKCNACSDFDFCDKCFKSDRDQHRSRHFFACIEKPIHQYQLQMPHLQQPFGGGANLDHLDFDHTIYLFNCIMQAGPRTMTENKFAKCQTLTGFVPDFLRRVLGPKNLVCIQRIEIKAKDFLYQVHNIQNGDYHATRVLK